MFKKILNTEDYEIFRKHKFNRDISEGHVQNLMKVIKEENKLHVHPIVVNENYEVLCGQHRLEAARRLKVPIYFIIEDCSDEHILRDNWAQRPSSVTEGLNFYVKKYDTPSYKFLQNVMQENNLYMKAAINLIHGMTNRTYDEIRKGTYKIKDLEEAEEVINRYIDIRDHLLKFDIKPFAMWRNAAFCHAFRVLDDNGVDWESFKDRVNTNWHKICHQPTGQLWITHLLKIYNFKRSKTLSIDD